MVFDAHVDVDADLTADAGHEMAAMVRERVPNPMAHVDTWRWPDRGQGRLPGSPG